MSEVDIAVSDTVDIEVPITPSSPSLVASEPTKATQNGELEETAATSALELLAENAQLMNTYQNRIAELELRLEVLKADDVKRAEEVEQIRIGSERRLLALENKVAEIQSRVLLLQASLVSSGTVIQRRQRA